jgi:hypothetical protein
VIGIRLSVIKFCPCPSWQTVQRHSLLQPPANRPYSGDVIIDRVEDLDRDPLGFLAVDGVGRALVRDRRSVSYRSSHNPAEGGA